MIEQKQLIIFEMANNHMGDIEHGKKMINEFSKVIDKYKNLFDFAWKFQFRDFETFIHKDYKSKMDHKYVKRFTETSLTFDEFTKLKQKAEECGFKTMCTGFDENSVNLIEKMGFEIIKVASCSFTDWPLLNRIVTCDKPIILSTAGASVNDIDSVVSFFKHRNKNISLMHCVGEYPTKSENLQLNQIDFLKNRYPGIKIGYSTHEEPNQYDAIKIAISKGISIAEKHVAIESEKYEINAYSVTPEQMDNWLKNAAEALNMCGISDKKSQTSDKELSDLLQFKRGVFIKNSIKKGDIISKNDIYYAWPNIPGQMLANDMSKYNQFIALEDIEIDKPLMSNKTIKSNNREKVWDIVQKVKDFIRESSVVYPGEAELEISHHYGIDKFYETGITMITVVNREYCKKLIIVLPNQTHPEQYHLQKEETFVILHGEVELILDGVKKVLKKGDVITIEKEVRHEFSTKTGCIIEEVSSTHYINDSYYTNESISKNKDRKTFVTHWI
jgi:sialic acid synthase SpsE/quercetin dioxygenase-like cupin family protein